MSKSSDSDWQLVLTGMAFAWACTALLVTCISLIQLVLSPPPNLLFSALFFAHLLAFGFVNLVKVFRYIRKS
jgi:hypothetical protein